MAAWDYEEIKLCQEEWAKAQADKPIKSEQEAPSYSIPLEAGRGPQFVDLPEDTP